MSWAAGIKLDYAIKPLPWVIPEPVKGILDHADCDIAEILMNGVNDAGPMASMQDPARLNIYFVREIKYIKDGLSLLREQGSRTRLGTSSSWPIRSTRRPLWRTRSVTPSA